VIYSDCSSLSIHVMLLIYTFAEMQFRQVADEKFESTWRQELESSLNDAAFPEKGPLWR
jgi:hypothetical protein